MGEHRKGNNLIMAALGNPVRIIHAPKPGEVVEDPMIESPIPVAVPVKEKEAEPVLV